MLDFLITGIIVGVVAHAWVNILTKEGMILGCVGSAMKWLRQEKWIPEWIYNPVIGCHICNAGQIALWFYVFTHFGWGLISLQTLEVIPFVMIAVVTAQKLDS